MFGDTWLLIPVEAFEHCAAKIEPVGAPFQLFECELLLLPGVEMLFKKLNELLLLIRCQVKL